MGEYVLFSPIGKSDPTRDNYDGAFLHILRHYEPQKAYLYMTKEICGYDELDNRYEAMASKLLPDCGIAKIKYPDVDRPNDFEYFHKPFKKEIEKIRKENPDAGILVNMSSGTPQMKAALYMLCTLEKEPIKPIQVNTPALKGNMSKPVDENYNIEDEWETLLDNEPGSLNRCVEVKVENAWALVTKEIIKDQIRTYDYGGAAMTAKQAKSVLGSRLVSLLEIGNARLDLSIRNAEKLAREAGYDFSKVINNSAKTMYEYLLYLGIKAKRGEFADFTRGVSPVITDLFEAFLERKSGADLSSYSILEGSMRKLVRSKMTPEILEYYDSSFPDKYRDSYFSGAVLLPLIEFMEGKGSDVSEKAGNIAGFEKVARNIAAHEIEEISERWLVKKTGMKAVDMLNHLKWMFEEIFPEYKEVNIWSAYNDLNKEIERELSK